MTPLRKMIERTTPAARQALTERAFTRREAIIGAGTGLLGYAAGEAVSRLVLDPIVDEPDMAEARMVVTDLPPRLVDKLAPESPVRKALEIWAVTAQPDFERAVREAGLQPHATRIYDRDGTLCVDWKGEDIKAWKASPGQPVEDKPDAAFGRVMARTIRRGIMRGDVSFQAFHGPAFGGLMRFSRVQFPLPGHRTGCLTVRDLERTESRLAVPTPPTYKSSTGDRAALPS